MVEIGEQPSRERRGDCDYPVAMCRVTWRDGELCQR
jgi:hypothetical protein